MADTIDVGRSEWNITFGRGWSDSARVAPGGDVEVEIKRGGVGYKLGGSVEVARIEGGHLMATVALRGDIGSITGLRAVGDGQSEPARAAASVGAQLVGIE